MKMPRILGIVSIGRLAEIGFLLSALMAPACVPSAYVYEENAFYNFTDEGFLASDLLQTMGTARVTRFEAGLEAGRTRCLEDAFYAARDRAVSAMLHTNLEIPPSSKSGSGIFEIDYPFRFESKDLLLATIDFEPLLREGFIAMQDSRTPTECAVVYRIKRERLAESIRSVMLTFCIEGVPVRTLQAFLNHPDSCEE